MAAGGTIKIVVGDEDDASSHVEREVAAFVRDAGLAIHVRQDQPGWTVTHEGSGRVLCHFPTQGAASAALKEFLALADWTLPVETLRGLKVADAVDAIVAQHKGTFPRRHA